jgi:hypothetical protein
MSEPDEFDHNPWPHKPAFAGQLLSHAQIAGIIISERTRCLRYINDAVMKSGGAAISESDLITMINKIMSGK